MEEEEEDEIEIGHQRQKSPEEILSDLLKGQRRIPKDTLIRVTLEVEARLIKILNAWFDYQTGRGVGHKLWIEEELANYRIAAKRTGLSTKAVDNLLRYGWESRAREATQLLSEVLRSAPEGIKSSVIASATELLDTNT